MRRCQVCGELTNNQEEVFGKWWYIHGHCADNPDTANQEEGDNNE